MRNLHQAQREILAKSKRFNVIKCGRRFGKTELTQELAVETMLQGYPVGYFTPTYKDLYEVWQSMKYILKPVTRSINESVKQITLLTSGKIDFWSMEDPDSGRGRKYKRAIVDECEKSGKFETAWNQTIRPTLADFEGDAWFFSTPQFGKTYFKKLFENEKKFADWASFRYTTYDNPYIKKSEVDAAKAQLDDLVFRCEYMAEDVDLTHKPFAYAFVESKTVKEVTFMPQYPVMLSFDFNIDPITCLAAQDEYGNINVLNEFRLSNSNIYELCDVIKAKYPTAVFSVTGDATGRASNAMTIGNLNYYKVIKEKLWLADSQIKTPSVNPAVSDSRVLLNSILQNFPLNIDPSCTYLIEDLKYVEVNDLNEIDKSKDKHRSHLLDCLRYLLSTHYSHLIYDFANLPE